MSWFANLSKALKIVPVVALALDALEDGKLDGGEIVTILDEGLDAIGIRGLDNSDIFVEELDGGGFSVTFSAKATEKLSIDL